MKILKISGIVLCIALFVFGLNSLIRLNTWETLNDIKLEDILQLGETKHNIKYLKTEDIEVVTDKWNISSPVCLEAQEGDSQSFGGAIAINDQYLAVGDPRANKVIIYSHDKNSDWIREREIKPPKNSIPDKVGLGFGHNLALDRDNLVIVASIEQSLVKMLYPEDYRFKNMNYSYFEGVYKTTLNKDTVVKSIDTTQHERKRVISIAANKGKIAFTSVNKKRFKEEINKVNILSKEKKTYLTQLYTVKKDHYFSIIDIDLKDNLLVAITTENPQGYAWLFDLNTPNKEPQDLSLPNISNYLSVAISDQFFAAVLPGNLYRAYGHSNNLYSGIVIKDIKNISNSTIIQGYDIQRISLNKNMLARITTPRVGIEGTSSLEVFYLDEDTIPHLILKRIANKDYANLAALHEGLLATTRSQKVCLEYLSEIKQY